MPLSFFRRKKQSEPAPAEQAAAPEAREPDPVAQPRPAAPDEGAPDAGEPGPKKRRRGSRGGRGRKKAGAAAPADAAENTPEAAKPAAKKQPARKPAERKAADKGEKPERKDAKRQGRQPSRRRTPPKRAPLPQAKRELLVSIDVGERRVAVLEDDRVAEVYLERPEKRSIAGNIYKGSVDNVLPGMEAAFVEIGLEKNGFLYVDEIVGPELEGRKGARKIQDLISRGQEVLVQAVKDPMKTKGARLTTEISLPGRFVVYQPHGEGLGVSRRLEDDERTRLKEIVRAIAPQPKGGIIVRTAAEGASAEDIERDFVFLQRLWRTIEQRAKTAKAPTLVYQEAELPLRVTRDLFTGDFEKAYVDNDRAYKRVVGYLKKTSPHMVERVVRYKEREPLFDAFGVQAEIESTLNRRVDLPSGGYLVFDYAEAFTVVDVNTGRFVGSRSRSSGARLEDTITKNNLEAVKEVVRQLRLRDIGGIIVIDFIDMANPKNRAAVEEALRSELERDRTKTYVVEISPLGLVEMTRQNVTDGPREVMTRKCPTCNGDGIVRSERTTAIEIERKLRALAAPGSRSKAFRVELNARIAALLAGPGASRLVELEELTKKRFFLAGKEDVHLDHFLVLEQGTLQKLQPEAPIAEGAEVELKPVEVGLHDPQSGVAKLDGLDVSVGGAAKLVGKKVKARVVRVLDGVVYAELLEPVAAVDAPLTAEAEAEKPTRAPRKKAAAAEPDAELDAGDAETPPEEAVADLETEFGSEPEPVVAAEGEPSETGVSEDGAAKKKRTRRGSRGGRRRKKTAGAAADGVESAEAAGAESAPAEAPGPRIHVPAVSLGRDGSEPGPAAAASAATRPRATGPDPTQPETAQPETAQPETAQPETAHPETAQPGAAQPEAAEPGAAEPDATGPETAEGAEAGEPPKPKKKTRRGTRGGRSRKKKVAGTVPPDGEPVAAGPEAPAEAEAPREPALEREPEPELEPEAGHDAGPAAQNGDPGYVPMSEWIDDFERAERPRSR